MTESDNECRYEPKHERDCLEEEKVCYERVPQQICLRICRDRKFYLYDKDNRNQPIFIAPYVSVDNYVLHLKYDLKDDSLVVLPKDTKIIGKWVNYGNRIRFQALRVRLDNQEYPFVGLSEEARREEAFNRCDIVDSPFFHSSRHYMQSQNVVRTANVRCRGKVLRDVHLNTLYNFYPTNEITCKLVDEFQIITERF